MASAEGADSAAASLVIIKFDTADTANAVVTNAITAALNGVHDEEAKQQASMEKGALAATVPIKSLPCPSALLSVRFLQPQP